MCPTENYTQCVYPVRGFKVLLATSVNRAFRIRFLGLTQEWVLVNSRCFPVEGSLPGCWWDQRRPSSRALPRIKNISERHVPASISPASTSRQLSCTDGICDNGSFNNRNCNVCRSKSNSAHSVLGQTWDNPVSCLFSVLFLHGRGVWFYGLVFPCSHYAFPRTLSVKEDGAVKGSPPPLRRDGKQRLWRPVYNQEAQVVLIYFAVFIEYSVRKSTYRSTWIQV